MTKRRSSYEKNSNAKASKPKITRKNSYKNHFQTRKKIVTNPEKIDHTPKAKHSKKNTYTTKKLMSKRKQKNPIKGRTPPDDWGNAQETATVVVH